MSPRPRAARLDRVLGEAVKGGAQHRSAAKSAAPALLPPCPTAVSPDDTSLWWEYIARWVVAEARLAWKLGAESLTSVLNPDEGTELFLRLTRQDDILEASLRCEHGDSTGLRRDWRTLQRSLARQSVRLLPLHEGPRHEPAASAWTAAESPSTPSRDPFILRDPTFAGSPG